MVLMCVSYGADFKEVLPEVCSAVQEADFISIDGEFTGQCFKLATVC